MGQGNGLLIGFGGLWAMITGAFFSLPELSPWVGMGGIAIAVLYAAMVCQLQRRAMAVAMGLTVLGAIALPSPETLLVNAIVAMTLCLNFWVFAELGIPWLQHLNQRQVFLRLAGLFSGALGTGWAVAVLFG